ASRQASSPLPPKTMQRSASRNPGRTPVSRYSIGCVAMDQDSHRPPTTLPGTADLRRLRSTRLEGDLAVPTDILQTLDRGLEAVELISKRTAGISPADLAEELGVHRA